MRSDSPLQTHCKSLETPAFIGFLTGRPDISPPRVPHSAGMDLQPQLWVADTAAATAYYQRAFGAVVEHRVGPPDDPDGVVQLSVRGARFWVSGASDELRRFDPASLGGATGRLLLVVDDPPAVAEAAVSAGGHLKSPVAEEHGWLVGRVVDPFGHEWEIGRPLGAWPPHTDRW
jgi:PhnB protein